MKDARIHKLRQWAEKDLRISHCARALLFRVYSDRYTDPTQLANQPFELPWTQIAHWCGLHDRMNCYDRSEELVRAGYLFDEGIKGCPPTKVYKLNLKLNLADLVRGKGAASIIPPTARRQRSTPAYVKKGLAALKASVK